LVKITIKGLSFSYGSSKILEDLSLVVEDSEVVSLIGPNGSGKTTLLKCIDGILKPRGSILLDGGSDLRTMGRQETAKLIGYVPQSSASMMGTTVFDVVLMGRKPHMGWQVGDEDMNKVIEVMKLLQVDRFALKEFNELSGGQKQRILIARALAQEPGVLLLDEPTASLDLKHQLGVLEAVRRLIKETDVSAIMAIHDLNLAARFSDKLVMLKDGRIHAMGDPRELLTRENVRDVFDVEAEVMNGGGCPYVVPISSLHEAAPLRYPIRT
jgi:iron complex transport system ATP-binding protein